MNKVLGNIDILLAREAISASDTGQDNSDELRNLHDAARNS